MNGSSMLGCIAIWCLSYPIVVNAFPQDAVEAPAEEMTQTSIETQKQLGKTALERLLTGRELLKSGVFRGSEKSSQTKDPGAKPTETLTEFDGAFDVERGRYRFHYRRGAGVDRDSLYIETPEGASLTSRNAGRPRFRIPAGFRLQPFQFVDARTFGVANPPEVDTIRYEKFAKYLRSLQDVQGTNDVPERIDLEVLEFKGAVQRRMILDIAKGYAPVRMEMRYRKKPEENWSEPQYIVEVEWEEHDKVFVPCRVAMSRPQWRSEVRELKFEWSNINKNVDARLFDHGW